MTSSIVVKFTCFLVGLVIGGGVVYGVVKLTERNTGSSDSVSNATGIRAVDSLQFVVVVSRHGNRGGSIDYPGDPHPLNNTSDWPYGKNALTPVGRVQEYKLGKKIRSLYNGFLPTTFRSDDIYACSDLYERVVMSGDLVLAGLYPPEGWQVWDQDIKWQPIALYTNSSDKSKTIHTCQRYNQEKAKAMAIFLDDYALNVSIITDAFYKQSGVNYTVDDISYMFEKVISEVTEGYSVADWIKEIYPQPFTDFYKAQFLASIAGSDEVSRLWVGNMVEEIVATMESKVSGTSDRKMSYYSGHDVTIINLEVALGVPRADLISMVRPGSALIVELHKDNEDNYSVQVLFIDGALTDLEPVSLTLSCDFNTFLDNTVNFTNVSYDEECLTTA